MTFFATDFGLFPKLAAMDILMAINAMKRQGAVADETRGRQSLPPVQQLTFDRLNQKTIGIFFGMTFPTRHFLMRSNQCKARRIMIEFGLIPSFIQVANLTTAFSHAFGELSGMHILMTSLAASIWKNEKQLSSQLAGILASVTSAARYSQMRPQQSK